MIYKIIDSINGWGEKPFEFMDLFTVLGLVTVVSVGFFLFFSAIQAGFTP